MANPPEARRPGARGPRAGARPAAALLALVLSACAVGPDFQRPAAPRTAGFVPPDARLGPQALAPGELPRRWWTLFGSPELDALVAQALERHPGIEAAQAALLAARETRLAQQGAWWPSLSASLNPSRQKVAPVLAPPLSNEAAIYNLSTAQLTVGFVPDVFGGNRRAVESLAAQEEAQAFQLEATRQSLAANLVAAVIQEAALRAQIAATNDAVRTAGEALELSRRQFRLGGIAEAGVIAQQAALAQTETALPVLRKQLAAQRDLIAQLSGRLPADAAVPPFDFSKLSMPAHVPVSAPSALVERRPDVRSAEAQWHAATAQVGVATAARFPSFGITGAYGGMAGGLAAALNTGSAFWSIGAGVAQSVFQGGTLRHRQLAAAALADQAGAQYRATVLSAFQNVADALQALDADRDAIMVSQRAEQAAQRSLDVAMRQFRFGDISYLTMLNARQTWQQAVSTRLQAQAGALADVNALCLALGGGWSDGDAPAPGAPAPPPAVTALRGSS